MNIRQIQSFIAVADTKSFSEAARLMYTSVSQISKLVKGLEEELGQVFFDRKKNGVALTHEGAKIYNIANRILRDIDDLEFMKERRGKTSLTVVGLPDVCLDDIFIEYMNARSNEDCFYNLSNKAIDATSQELHVKKADIGFAYVEKLRLTAIKMRLKDFALNFTPITKAQKYIFVNKKHPLAKNETICVKQLENVGQIKINGTDFLNSEINKSNDLNVYSKPAIRMITHNLSTALRIAAKTDMVYIGCDVFNVAGGIEDLKRIPVEDSTDEEEFGYIKRYNLALTPAAEEFLGYIRSVTEVYQ